jgi:hypothetical protein
MPSARSPSPSPQLSSYVLTGPTHLSPDRRVHLVVSGPFGSGWSVVDRAHLRRLRPRGPDEFAPVGCGSAMNAAQSARALPSEAGSLPQRGVRHRHRHAHGSRWPHHGRVRLHRRAAREPAGQAGRCGPRIRRDLGADRVEHPWLRHQRAPGRRDRRALGAGGPLGRALSAGDRSIVFGALDDDVVVFLCFWSSERHLGEPCACRIAVHGARSTRGEQRWSDAWRTPGGEP